MVKHTVLFQLRADLEPQQKTEVMALCGEFDTLADVDAYARHPLHVAVAAQLKPYVSARSCTDYEI